MLWPASPERVDRGDLEAERLVSGGPNLRQDIARCIGSAKRGPGDAAKTRMGKSER